MHSPAPEGRRRITTWDANLNFGIQGQAWWGNVPLAYHDGNNQTYFEQPDWEGTQRVLTDYAGNVTSIYKSNPFGEGYSSSGQDDNRFHYGYLERDPETFTEHAGSRQYDSAVGIWMSMDPYMGSYSLSSAQSLNRYTYASNTPTFKIDPSGRDDGLTWVVDVVCGGSPGACAGATLDPAVAVVVGALGAIAEIGDLLGWWGAPHFKGSLHPRPTVTTTISKGYYNPDGEYTILERVDVRYPFDGWDVFSATSVVSITGAALDPFAGGGGGTPKGPNPSNWNCSRQGGETPYQGSCLYSCT